MGKRLIEPPFCVAMFSVSLALAIVTGVFFVVALLHGEWFRAFSLLLMLLSQGVFAGAQVYFIASFFWRLTHELVLSR